MPCQGLQSRPEDLSMVAACGFCEIIWFPAGITATIVTVESEDCRVALICLLLCIICAIFAYTMPLSHSHGITTQPGEYNTL